MRSGWVTRLEPQYAGSPGNARLGLVHFRCDIHPSCCNPLVRHFINMNFIVFIVSVAFIGSAHAACDNTTAAKVEECVFMSDLFDPAKLPDSEAAVDSYCNANATLGCMATKLGDCNDDERQMNLLKNMVTAEKVLKNQMYLCDNKTAVLEGNYDCLNDLKSQQVQDCLQAAVGGRVNAGPEKELKTRLDDMCTFFAAYAQCFEGEGVTENCKNVIKDSVMMAVQGMSYAYCDLDAAGKESVVNAYTVGSSSVLAASIVTVFAALLLSVFN